MNHQRRPAGTPTGGQFAPTTHAEASISLTEDPTAESFEDLVDEWIEWRASHDAIERRVALGRPVSGSELAESQERGLALADRFALSGGSVPSERFAEPEVDSRIDDEWSTQPAVVDRLISEDGQTFVRWGSAISDDDWARLIDSQAVRIQSDRPITDDEIEAIAGMAGYAYRSTIAGEMFGQAERDSTHSFIIPADATKSPRSDLGGAFSEFPEKLGEIVVEGSPVRTTNRAGPGTQGTRLIEGLAESAPRIEVYYAI